ncbi:MAG TPA: hypothetical protein VE890_13090, partial [Thermoguttaceae bacterium]|nr:hypothetical protein [Thermoguttaceae bacterium]
MVHNRNSITASTGWLLLLLLCGGCITHPLGVRDPVAPTAFPDHDLVPLHKQADVAKARFYGYNATCWRPWPMDWQGCPPQDSGMVLDQNVPFQPGMEFVDEVPQDGIPHADVPAPTLAPIPVSEGAGPAPKVPEPYSPFPAEPVPTDMMPEISEEGPPSDDPAKPDFNSSPGVPTKADPVEVNPIEPEPAELPTPAVPQKPEQTHLEPRVGQPAAGPVAVQVLSPTTP